MTTANIFLVTGDGKLHRGYRDESGRFTLEQCNLDAADSLREFPEGSDTQEGQNDWTMCENCFPGEDYVGRIP